MSGQVAPDADSTDTCSRCGRETSHAVRVEIRADTTSSTDDRFARKRHRVSTCLVCETESAVPMPDG